MINTWSSSHCRCASWYQLQPIIWPPTTCGQPYGSCRLMMMVCSPGWMHKPRLHHTLERTPLVDNWDNEGINDDDMRPKSVDRAPKRWTSHHPLTSISHQNTNHFRFYYLVTNHKKTMRAKIWLKTCVNRKWTSCLLLYIGHKWTAQLAVLIYPSVYLENLHMVKLPIRARYMVIILTMSRSWWLRFAFHLSQSWFPSGLFPSMTAQRYDYYWESLISVWLHYIMHISLLLPYHLDRSISQT